MVLTVPQLPVEGTAARCLETADCQGINAAGGLRGAQVLPAIGAKVHIELLSIWNQQNPAEP